MLDQWQAGFLRQEDEEARQGGDGNQEGKGDEELTSGLSLEIPMGLQF